MTYLGTGDMAEGLVIQSHRRNAGKLLPRDHPQYAGYLSAIETAIDAREADELCAVLLK